MDRPSRTHLLLVALLAAAVRLSVVLHPVHGAMDGEESATPAAAMMLLWTGLSSLWDYRYMPVCGGCTLGTLAAAPTFAVVGPTVMAWKVLLLAFPVALALAAWTAGWRLYGRGGAALMAVAAIFPPALGDALHLRGWLNHAESTSLALAAACLVATAVDGRRAALAGLLAGLALSVGLTAAVTVAATVVVLLLERSWRQAAAFGAASTWCVLTWAAAWVGGVDPFDVETRLAWARTGRPLGQRVAELVEVQRLDDVFGLGPWVLPGSGVVLLAAALVAGVAVVRWGDRLGRTALVGSVAWLVTLLLGPGELHMSTPPYEAHDRYLVVLSLAVPLVVGSGALTWWQRGWRRVGGSLAAALLVVGVGTCAVRLAGPRTLAIATCDPVDWAFFRIGIVQRALPEPTWTCGAVDERCRDLRAWSLGAFQGHRLRQEPGLSVPVEDDPVWQDAFAAALAAHVGAEDLAGLEALLDAHLPPSRRSLGAALSGWDGLAPLASSVGPGDGLDAASRSLVGWAWGITHGWRLVLRSDERPTDDADFGVGWAYATGQLAGARFGGGFTLVDEPGWSAPMQAAYGRGVADGVARAWMAVPEG